MEAQCAARPIGRLTITTPKLCMCHMLMMTSPKTRPGAFPGRKITFFFGVYMTKPIFTLSQLRQWIEEHDDYPDNVPVEIRVGCRGHGTAYSEFPLEEINASSDHNHKLLSVHLNFETDRFVERGFVIAQCETAVNDLRVTLKTLYPRGRPGLAPAAQSWCFSRDSTEPAKT